MFSKYVYYLKISPKFMQLFFKLSQNFPKNFCNFPQYFLKISVNSKQNISSVFIKIVQDFPKFFQNPKNFTKFLSELFENSSQKFLKFPIYWWFSKCLVYF